MKSAQVLEEYAGWRVTQAGTARGVVECASSGEGPAVLLLHGAMGGWDQGVLLARSAVGSGAFQFIAVSRPGYLGTALSLGKSPEEQADLCAAVLDALGIGECAIVAISGGGQCALQFALRWRERCTAVVMISACSAPIDVPVPFAWHVMKLAARIPGLPAMMSRRALEQPERAARRSIPDPDLRARTLNHPEAGSLMMALQRSTMDRMAQRIPGTQNDIDQSRRRFDYPVEEIRAPLLAVHGTADRVAPYAQSEALARRVPRAELFSIEGGEHVSLFTHLDEIRARVRSFLGASVRRAHN